jgi:riboflavin synthase
VTGDQFEVWIIPHTKANTTLLQKKIGDPVNIEVDMIAKYIEKLSKR